MQSCQESTPDLYLLAQTRCEYKVLRAQTEHQGERGAWRERGAVEMGPKLKALLEDLLLSTLVEERETV